MNLLFILNKVILELSSSRATDLFQDILEIVSEFITILPRP